MTDTRISNRELWNRLGEMQTAQADIQRAQVDMQKSQARLDVKVESTAMSVSDIKGVFSSVVHRLDDLFQRVTVVETKLGSVLDGQQSKAKADMDLAIGVRVAVLSGVLIFAGSVSVYLLQHFLG